MVIPKKEKKMKKIFYLLAAAATLLAASCNKIETTEQEITPDAIQLNIKVANLTGTPDTKAAKTGWVSGDKSTSGLMTGTTLKRQRTTLRIW